MVSKSKLMSFSLFWPLVRVHTTLISKHLDRNGGVLFFKFGYVCKFDLVFDAIFISFQVAGTELGYPIGLLFIRTIESYQLLQLNIFGLHS